MCNGGIARAINSRAVLLLLPGEVVKRPIIKLPLFLHCCLKRLVTVMLLSESAICPRDGQMER